MGFAYGRNGAGGFASLCRIVNDSDGILTVGAGATISAGAVVTHSVGAGQKLAGNPAQELRSLAAGRRT